MKILSKSDYILMKLRVFEKKKKNTFCGCSLALNVRFMVVCFLSPKHPKAQPA